MMKTKNRFFKIFLWLFLYSAAMAFIESAVVVYLRELYYPEGFDLIIKQIPFRSSVVEIAREAATIIMLVAVAILSARSRAQRISAFIFCFGVWDIFYYIWLKVILNWPAGIMDWDVLFLIPRVWISPVLAPVLVSLGLIISGAAVAYLDMQGKPVRLGWLEWRLIPAGIVIIYLSFTINSKISLRDLTMVSYPWWLFILGFGMAMTGVWLMVRRTWKQDSRIKIKD